MECNRSFLSFSPKISKKGNKENIPLRKSPKFCTRKLTLADKNTKPLAPKYASPSNLKNVSNNIHKKSIDSKREEEKLKQSYTKGNGNVASQTAVFQKEKLDCSVQIVEKDDADSVIVISDSSEIFFTPASQWRKPRADSSSSDKSTRRHHGKTVVLETSDSGSDLLDSSQKIRIRPLLPRKPDKLAENDFLSSSKYNAITNWLDKASLSDATTHSDSCSEGKEHTSETSLENILNELYGPMIQKEHVFAKTPQVVKKRINKEKRAVTDTRLTKKTTNLKYNQTSESDDNFDNFVQNVRQKFESTRKKWSSPANNSFIDDNSLQFYVELTNKVTSEAKKKCDAQEKCTPIPPKKLFFSDDSVSSVIEQPKVKKKVSAPKGSSKVNRKKVIDKQPSPLRRSNCDKPVSFLRSLSASPPGSQCHPKAQMYKKDFKKLKEQLVSELFKLYNEVVFDNQFPADMRIEWNARMKSSAGYCYNRRVLSPTKGKMRTSRIELASKVCATPDRVRDTLIHELCHAATWVIDDVKGGHGPHWKAWAQKARKRLPDLPPIKRCHEYVIETKYTYKCTKCGYSFGRHSKSLNLAVKRCGYCLGTFEVLVNMKPTKEGSAATSRTPRNPTGFALYVKKNYRSLKSARTDLKHADIMRLLGQQFSQLKLGSVSEK